MVSSRGTAPAAVGATGGSSEAGGSRTASRTGSSICTRTDKDYRPWLWSFAAPRRASSHPYQVLDTSTLLTNYYYGYGYLLPTTTTNHGLPQNGYSTKY